MYKPCNYCAIERPRRCEHCPHCGQPSYFPNVEDAVDEAEVRSLEARVKKAESKAHSQGSLNKLRHFASNVERDSVAVFACPITKLMPLACGLTDIYATYHDLNRLRLPKKSASRSNSPNWDKLRQRVEGELFGDDYKERVHYACLSLNGRGLTNYGECSVVLRTPMISHRASVFESNSITFVLENNLDLNKEGIPPGYRAHWGDRGKLAFAKMSSVITSATRPSRFPAILMSTARNRASDNFVEVHVYGSITAFTIQQVTVAERKLLKSAGNGGQKRNRKRRGMANIAILSETLAQSGATLRFE